MGIDLPSDGRTAVREIGITATMKMTTITTGPIKIVERHEGVIIILRTRRSKNGTLNPAESRRCRRRRRSNIQMNLDDDDEWKTEEDGVVLQQGIGEDLDTQTTWGDRHPPDLEEYSEEVLTAFDFSRTIEGEWVVPFLQRTVDATVTFLRMRGDHGMIGDLREKDDLKMISDLWMRGVILMIDDLWMIDDLGMRGALRMKFALSVKGDLRMIEDLGMKGVLLLVMWRNLLDGMIAVIGLDTRLPVIVGEEIPMPKETFSNHSFASLCQLKCLTRKGNAKYIMNYL